ncbi:MFS transporter [Streptomyces sp. bgisy154]|uniref:MFS transporter n=1 Tax=Streptomyces sp. bgisy154 TaxID=3413794 RepID=UPI003D72F3D2
MNRPLVLAASIAGAVVVALDGTVLTVAQPVLRQDLGASYAEAQWTSTGYLIAVAGLLVFAGRLADRYGHRRTFAAGMLGFGSVSAGVAVAPDVRWVVALRVVQGVFGALLQPATLGMLRAAFPPDRLRGPLAARTAAIGVAAAAGPLLGGALATGFGWRSVFLVQVGPALLFGVLALLFLAEPGPPAGEPAPARDSMQRPSQGSRVRPAGPPLDVPGAVLLGLALAALVHALVALSGWSLAGAGAAAVAFVRHERRTAAPLVPAEVVGVPAVRAALGVLVAVSAALNGALFAGVYALQRDLGLTPLGCALAGLPLAVLLIAAAPAAAVLLRRVGARRTTAVSAVLVGAGVLLPVRASGAAVFCVGFALVGAGFGAVMVAASHVVVRRAPVASAGVAGGLQQTAMNVGPALGVAVATVLMTAGGARWPLPVLALCAAVAVPLARALPGRPGEGRRDAAHTRHAAESGPSRR